MCDEKDPRDIESEEILYELLHMKYNIKRFLQKHGTDHALQESLYYITNAAEALLPYRCDEETSVEVCLDDVNITWEEDD